MSYDFDDEDSCAEPRAISHDASVSRVSLRIEGPTAARIEDNIIEIVSSRVRKRIEEEAVKTVQAEVRKAIDERIKAITAAALEESVASIIAEGWQKTDSYGSPSGPKQTVRDRVTEMMFNDGYGRRADTLQKIIDKRVNDAIAQDCKDVIAEAKEKFRVTLDTTLNAKLQETLRNALGLK